MGDKSGNNELNYSKDFLLAEYNHFAESFWRNEEVGEKRVNFFITLVTAVLAAIVALATKDGDFLTTGVICPIAIFALLLLLLFGRVILKRMIKRNITTDEYKMAMAMIRSRFRHWGDQIEDYIPFGKGLKASIVLTSEMDLKNDKSILTAAKQALIDNRIEISEDYGIVKKSIGWIVADKEKKKYLIWNEKNELKIYEEIEARKLGYGGLVDMVISINSIIVAALFVLIPIWVFQLKDCLKFSTIQVAVIILLGLIGFFTAYLSQRIYTRNCYAKQYKPE
ncbi:MAG: hypothetical protein AMS23_02615 [Bacteroides sp. SM1_62]|nr:MAG: hypothetical protein AMS23_02615 [Bacteroides sp. SM1_62]